MDKIDKKNNTEGWNLNNAVLGAFLFIFAIFMTLFAGTIGFVITMPFTMLYLSRFFRKVMTILFTALMFSLIALIYKNFFGYSNLEIFSMFLLVGLLVLFFKLNRNRKKFPPVKGQ